MACTQTSLLFLLCVHTDGLVTPFLSLKAEKQQDKTNSYKKENLCLFLKKDKPSLSLRFQRMVPIAFNIILATMFMLYYV